MDDTEEWTTLCGSFEGGGCADRLLVGNFSSDASTTIIQHDPSDGPFAYYFVDDVSLWRTGTIQGCTTTCPEERPGSALPADTVATWPPRPIDLYFAVNDHVPGEDLLQAAEDLLRYFVDRPNAQVRIEGHTDDSGTASANHRLSERRAQSVRGRTRAAGSASQAASRGGARRPWTDRHQCHGGGTCDEPPRAHRDR